MTDTATAPAATGSADDSLRRTLGSRLTQLRGTRGWNQRELARRAQIDPGRLSKLERGVVRVSIAELIRLSLALGASLDELVFGVAPSQAELRTMIVELEALRSRLAEVHARLPVPPEETAMLVGEKEIDVATEVRSTIECVLKDSIEPAIRDLAAAASYRPQEMKV